jgi:hypothetical protein
MLARISLVMINLEEYTKIIIVFFAVNIKMTKNKKEIKTKKVSQEVKNYQKELIKQMLQLTTSGIGLVAALAWNELIKSLINDYIKTKISLGSGLISAAIYAILVTGLAVLITIQLSKISQRLGNKK